MRTFDLVADTPMREFGIIVNCVYVYIESYLQGVDVYYYVRSEISKRVFSLRVP